MSNVYLSKMSMSQVIDIPLGNLRLYNPQIANILPKTLYAIRFAADALSILLRCVSNNNNYYQINAKLTELQQFHLLQSHSQLLAARHSLIKILEQYKLWIHGTILNVEQLEKFNHMYKRHAILAAKRLKEPNFHSNATPLRSFF